MDEFLRMAETTVSYTQSKQWYYRKSQFDPTFDWGLAQARWESLGIEYASEDYGDLVLFKIRRERA